MTKERDEAIQKLFNQFEHRDFSKCGVYNVYVVEAESGLKSRKQFYAVDEVEAMNLLLLEAAILDDFYQIDRIEKVR